MAKSLRVLISADPQNNNTAGKYTNMTLKAAMLYDKALTTNEVSDLTNYFTNNDVKTKNIDVPTFRETNTSSDKDATITYPNGCGSIYTCSYSKDNGDFITVTSNPTMSFASHGTFIIHPPFLSVYRLCRLLFCHGLFFLRIHFEADMAHIHLQWLLLLHQLMMQEHLFLLGHH